MGLASFSPVAVDVQDDMRGADGDGHLVPLVVRQAVGEHLGVGLLASGAVVETHLAALAAALQLQEPAEGKVILPRPGSAGNLGLYNSTCLSFFTKDVICRSSCSRRPSSAASAAANNSTHGEVQLSTRVY